jgi:hypothetical protein
MYFVVEFEKRTVLALTAPVRPTLIARDQRLPASLAAPRRALLDNHIALLTARLTIKPRDNLP